MEAFEEPKPLLNYLIKPVPRTGGDLSRPLGRVPRFFVDIYVAAVHRSLLRPNHRTICNEKLAILRFAKRIRPNNIPQTGDFDEPFDLESSANSCLVVEKRRERKRRKENNALFLSSPSLLESPTLKHSCCTNPSVPFRSLPIRVTFHAHIHTHVHVYTRGEKSRGRRDGEIVTERGERERERYGKIRHRDVARGVSPPTESLAAAPLLRSPPPARARGLDAPLRTARRRLVASSARAHASRRARTSPLDCSFARPSRGHPPAYFPRS